MPSIRLLQQRLEALAHNRIARTAVGSCLILLGLLGLFLPFLQGILLIIAGVAIINPGFLRKNMERFKRQLHKKDDLLQKKR